MRHMKKVGPARPGVGFVLPEGTGWHYPLVANYYPHHDEFLGTTVDADEWATEVTSNTGASTVTVGSSFITLTGGTATASSTTTRFYSAMSADANIYTIPFRATFVARLSTTAGAGVAPTGGCDFYIGVRNTAQDTIAQFHLDGSTAGSSSLASPFCNVEMRVSSTAAGFIASAGHTIWASGQTRTATNPTGFVVEMTHQGTWFGIKRYMDDNAAPQQLSYFSNPVPRPDQKYYLDIRSILDGTAGFTQTGSVVLEFDSITVEQLAPTRPQAFSYISPEADHGAVRSALLVQPLATNAASLATSGAGTLLAVNVGTTASAGITTFIACYDASAVGTAVYDFGNGPSAPAQLLWFQQVAHVSSATVQLDTPLSTPLPAAGIPFFRGLIAAVVDSDANAAGSTAVNISVTYRGYR